MPWPSPVCPATTAGATALPTGPEVVTALATATAPTALSRPWPLVTGSTMVAMAALLVLVTKSLPTLALVLPLVVSEDI